MTKFYFLLALLFAAGGASAQTQGRVLGEEGAGLPGATVTAGKTRSVTGRDGGFSIPKGTGQLKISYVGYKDTTVNVLGRFSELIISLRRPSTDLSEVVVSTGYQELPAERATGSFVQVDRSLLERSVSTTVIDRLRDVVPGLHFDANSESFRIHGQSTLFSNADPLVVVDGFPYTSPITDLNPNDVESVSVLKDAAAASIWGTKAGNGVVVITTKRGNFNQAPVVNVSANVNVSNRPNLFYQPKMSTADYIGLEQQLFSQKYYAATEASPYGLPLSPVVELLIAQRDGKLSASSVSAQLAALSRLDVRNDVSKYLYRPSVDQQYAASVSGGSTNSRYFFSAGFDKNLDNLVGNGLDRVTVKGTNTWSFLDHRLEVTAGVNLTQTNTVMDNPGTITWNRGAAIYPYAQLADASGNPLSLTHDYRLSFIQTAQQRGLRDWSYSPLQELQLANNNTKVNDMRVNTGLKYKLPAGFAVEVLYQYDYAGTSGRNLQDANSYYTRNLTNRFTQMDASGNLTLPVPLGGIVDLGHAASENHDIRGQLDYNRTINTKHEVTAIAGYEVQSLHVLSDNSRLYGYDTEHATSVPVNAATQYYYYDNANSGTTIPTGQSESDATDHSISYYANAAYTYDRRLTLSASARLDESNLFGVKANQKGVPLYSVGTGWNISKEDFYKIRFLPELKLRATFGYNGNINKRLSAYTTASYQAGSNQATLLPFAVIVNPPNPELRWERDQDINLGADFGSKNQIVTGSIDFFWKKGMDLIGSTSYAPSTGITVFTGNTAGTTGHGLDLSLQARNLRGKISWTTNFFFSYVSDIVSQYGQQSTVTSYLQSGANGGFALQGKPLFAIYSNKWAGLDPATGNPRGYLNGAVSQNYNAMAAAATPQNLVYNGPSKPPVFGALRNTVSYRNWSLSANISYELGFYFRKNSVRYGSDDGLAQQSGDFALRWQKPGDEQHTNVPSMPITTNTARDDFYTYSSALVTSGNNVRLRDVRLSWRLKGLELYTYAANLGILWKANHFGQDPDYANTFPAPVTIAGGLRFTY